MVALAAYRQPGLTPGQLAPALALAPCIKPSLRTAPGIAVIRCSAHVLRPLPTARPSSAAAIACVMAGIFSTLSDASAKWLGASYHPLQILFLRALIALPVVTALALWLGGRRVLRTGHLRLHLARGAINVVSACCFYLGLNSLPLAEATAIAFAAPLFVTALSVFVLKERVDSRRWLAVLAGFAGVLDHRAARHRCIPGRHAAAAADHCDAVRGHDDHGARHQPSEGMLTTTFYIVAGQFLCSILTLPWVWRRRRPSATCPISLAWRCSARWG